METDLIKIKRLEDEKDLGTLTRGNIIILSLSSGKIYDNKEYYGPAVFAYESLNGTKYHGLNFCRPRANYEIASVEYHIPLKEISITETGVISSSTFYTFGSNDPELVKDLI